MRGKGRAILAAATIGCALIHSVAPLYGRDLAGVRMPEVVSAGGRVLVLNGRGIGEKMFVHVYVIGLYLETKTTDARTAMTSNEAKRMALILLRNVSRQQFVQAVEKGMMRNSGLPMPRLRARLDLLEQALPALAKGDRLDFTYLPGVGTVVRGHGRELTIPGQDFAEALFSVWLGPQAESRTLRQDLLGGGEPGPMR